MDIKLTNGDIGVSSSGEYDYVTGIDEALQQAILCTKIKKGSFIYNKALGTELRNIDIKSPVALKTAEMLLNEALMGSGFKVKVNDLSKTKEGQFKANIEVLGNDETKTAEVIFSADL